MIEEARLEKSDHGVAAVTDGWFVVNVRDAAWVRNEVLGAACIFEGPDGPEFSEVGFTLAVLQPGQAGGRYHRESNQEDFLVLAGECLLLIEGEERPLKAWDFVHCPPETEHIFVGAGRRPVRDLHVWRAHGREADHVPAFGARPPPRRGRRERDERAAGGEGALPEVAAGAAGKLARPALGLVCKRRRTTHQASGHRWASSLPA